MRRWLWLTPEVSSTLTTGGLLYSHEILRAVAAQGIDLTVVGLGTDTFPSGGPTDPTIVTVPGEILPPWRSIASPLPNQARACALPALRRAADDALRDGPWEAVVVDGLRMAWLHPLLAAARPATVVFFTHNHETSMRRAVAEETSWRSARRPLLELEARKTARLERRMLAAADVVTAITDDDRRRFSTDAPTATHVVLSPGWSGTRPSSPTPLVDRPRRVGILGSFLWHVKQESLRRFVTAAVPVFDRHRIELAIGGRMDDEFRAEIERHRCVTALGWVDEPADFLDTCRLGVVAESLGGGFKLKVLDYVFNEVPIAVLAASAAGLPFERGVDMIGGDTETELAAAIADHIDDVEHLAELAAGALAVAEEHFDWGVTGRLLTTTVTENMTKT